MRDEVTKLISAYDIVIFDCEFDLKYLNQVVDTDIDVTLVLAVPTEESIMLAQRIEEFSAKYAAGGQMGLVINRVRNTDMSNVHDLLSKFNLEMLGLVPEDENLAGHSLSRNSDVVSEALKQFYFRLNLPDLRNKG